ncbi:hypothetical protein P8785_10710, partial [Bacillus subtilis]|uniref:hypothetical protein n=1 Tax=Bacillus subtilis TaxID=1423 RepID=UPI002DB7944F
QEERAPAAEGQVLFLCPRRSGTGAPSAQIDGERQASAGRVCGSRKKRAAAEGQGALFVPNEIRHRRAVSVCIESLCVFLYGGLKCCDLWISPSILWYSEIAITT